MGAWFTVGNVGLIFGMAGTFLLFIWGFPAEIDLGGFDKQVESARTKSHFLAKVGIGLVFIGFVLQFVGNISPG